MRTRVAWTRVDGFIPEADLRADFSSIEDAQAACGRDAECGGFTFRPGADTYVPGAVLRVWHKRSSEWFVDSNVPWVSYVKAAAPCTGMAYRTHATGLLCCEGACPRTPAQARALDCEAPVALHEGVLPLCSALEAPPRAARAPGVRDWPPVRVLDLARAGVPSMSSAYVGGPSSWAEPRSATERSLEWESMIHTQCGPSEWWAVELPTGSEVTQVLVVNRPSYRFRLLNFQLELFDAAGALLEARAFTRASNHTAFVFEPPVQPARHVRIRGAEGSSNCLHLHRVVVLGRAAPSGAREDGRVRALLALGGAEQGERGRLRAPQPSARPSPLEGATSAMWLAGLAASVLLVGLQAWHMHTYLLEV